MDAKKINVILGAFSNVMPKLGLNNINRKDLKLVGKNISSKGVVIIIGFIGDVKGNLIYNLSINNAKKIASLMMMGMEVVDFNEIAQSAISELTNMITANAATNFANENINVDISTPTLIVGDFQATACNDKVISVLLDADGIEIEVNIAIN